MKRVEHHRVVLQAPRVGRDDLALRHDHDPVDIALDRHHLERELPRDAVPVAIEGDGLILVHRSRGADDAGIEPMVGKRYGGGLFLGEPRADHKRAEERLDGSLPLGFAALAKVHVQLIEVRHFGDRGGEAALHGLDGALGVGLLVAPSRHAEAGIEGEVTGQGGVAGMELALASQKDQRRDRLGVVPPDFLGDAAEELEGRDHAFEDRLGALKWQGQNEGIIGVGPGGDEKGDLPPALGEVNVDVTKIGFEPLAGKMSQRDERFALSTSMLEQITIARYSAAINGGLRDGAGCRRGGIVGRWTKPVAAPRVCDVRSLSRPQLGELYPGSRDAANLKGTSRKAT